MADALEAVAFLIPAIRPRLSLEHQPPDLASQAAGMAARNIVLPAGETGRRLLRHWYQQLRRTPAHAPWEDDIDQTRRGSGPSTTSPLVHSPWGMAAFAGLREDLEAPRARVERFLGNLPPPAGFDHWPVRLLRQQLGCYIEATTGDRTLAWLVTRRTEAEGEARLYYTQHRLDRLVQVYGDSLKHAGLERLLDNKLYQLSEDAANSDSDRPTTSAWTATLELWPWRDPVLTKYAAGAAFVPSFEAVQRLVRILRESASAPVDNDRRSSVRNHHHWLLLHTLVTQDLSTGLRPVRSGSCMARPTAMSQAL